MTVRTQRSAATDNAALREAECGAGVSQSRPVDVTQNLTYRIIMLASTLSRSASRSFADGAGISVPEWRVISVIGSRDQVSFNTLAQTLDVDKGWISRTLMQLESSGLVLRTPDPRDGRQFRLSLTKAGRALHLKGSSVSVGRQKHLESRFSATELAALYKLLGRLQQAADDML